MMTLWAAMLVAFAPQAALAQDVPPAATETVPAASSEALPAADTPDEGVEVGEGAEEAAPEAEAIPGYTPLGPDMIKGQPEDGSIDLQEQYSDIGDYAQPLHIGLVWVMAIISAFVLALLVWVVVRYNRRSNKVPSKTTHNTMIEVIWTIVPVLILVGIAIPSISLLARQYETPPEDAITIKAIGYQWYWGYEYPDNGGFEIISNMLDEDEARARGFPAQLEVDNRMVVPAGVPLRIQTTAADVIHSFAVPSLWFKQDAIPGRLNEKLLFIKEPGIYYGQCSELCGARHAYMPIAVEAVPLEQWQAWVLAQPGGTLGGDEDTPEPANLKAPVSAQPGAPQAGEAEAMDPAERAGETAEGTAEAEAGQ
ncbi:cytochrome c oxidase subunit II [Qipengyuania sp. JC766]|uniref:cytochrome c oxidase subunit II n=1 Tax=Qipengyuania sp. JC766 TaxID=3232139 RepID=UPI003459581E